MDVDDLSAALASRGMAGNCGPLIDHGMLRQNSEAPVIPSIREPGLRQAAVLAEPVSGE
jgi:hypothetical protein